MNRLATLTTAVYFFIFTISAHAASSQVSRFKDEASMQIPSLNNYSLMDPHVPPAEGPWFEGWYTRIAEEKSGRSVAVIVASNVSQGEVIPTDEIKNVRGYVAILVSEGGSSVTKSFEAFPSRTTIEAYGDTDLQNQSVSPDTDFRWSSPDHGFVTQDAIDITVDGVRVQAEFKNRIPWDKENPLVGPGGIASFIPLIPLQWHVHSLGSSAAFSVQSPEVNFSATGWAHQEKNWGAAFPKAWTWLQGFSENNQTQLAIAGGDLELGPLTVTTFLAGYRSPRVSVDFRPSQPGTSFEHKVDACNHTIAWEAKNAFYRMTVEASAPASTFGPVSIPTASGYQSNGGIESFSATISVKVYKRGLIPIVTSDELIDEGRFENAALEFGADWQECR